jgi:hypothetical protein
MASVSQALLLLKRFSQQLENRPHLKILIVEPDLDLDEPPPATSNPEPTNALPGTVEKLDVLCARYEAGELLWHPDDASIDSWLDDDFAPDCEPLRLES